MVGKGPFGVLSPTVWGICLVVALAGLGYLLLADPGADPPLGASNLEGQLLPPLPVDSAGGAMGAWDPGLLVPIKTSLDRLVFAVAGRSLSSVRRAHAVGALLVVVLLYGLLFRSGGKPAALLAALFLLVNPAFFAFARTTLPPVMSLLLMLTTIAVWQGGRSSNLLAFLSGMLIVITALVEDGPNNLFFLLAGGFMIVVVRLHAWKMTWAPASRRRTRWILAGMLVVLLAHSWRVLGNWQEMGALWSHFWNVSLRLMVANVVMTPIYVSKVVRLMPLVSLLALGSFLFFAKDVIRPVARHREPDEIRLWMLAWLLAGGVYFTLVAAPPLNALVLVVPPVCYLAADGVVRLFHLRRLHRPNLDVMIVILLLAAAVWFASAVTVKLVLERANLPGFPLEHRLRTQLVSVLLLWGVGTFAISSLYLKWRRPSVPTRSGPVTVIAVGVVLLVFLLNTSQILIGWKHRTHDVVQLQERVGRLGPANLVVGSWAPLAVLGSEVRAIVLWRGMNEAPAEWNGAVTHLLLQSGPESNPGLLPRSRFEARHPVPVGPPIPLGGKRVQLFALDGEP